MNGVSVSHRVTIFIKIFLFQEMAFNVLEDPAHLLKSVKHPAKRRNIHTVRKTNAEKGV